MSDLFAWLWILISIGFWVTLIMFIVNKLRKRSSKITWKTPLVLFVVGFAFLIAASITTDDSGDTDQKTTKKSSSIDKESLASSKAKASSKTASSEADEASRKSSSEADEASSKASSEADEASKKSSSEAAKASSKAAEKDPNSYKTGITYDQLARTPDDYKGKKIQFTGRVLQVMEDSSETQLRLAVDGNSDNVVLVGFDPDVLNGSRVLEDDLVTASGESYGTVSYKSTLSGKITIPALAAKIINDQGKASDDYGY